MGFELCTECEQRVYLILQDGKPFARRQRKHPADQREVHAIFTALWHHVFSVILYRKDMPAKLTTLCSSMFHCW